MIQRFGDVGKSWARQISTFCITRGTDEDEEDVRQGQRVWRAVEMLSRPGTMLLWKS